MSIITHKQIRNHFKDNFNANDVKYEDIRIITEYISQQEKREKLLELYKEKDKLKDFFAMGSIRAEKYKKIEKQIKELENDK